MAMTTGLGKELEILADVTRAFAESLDLEHTIRSILRRLQTHFGLYRGTVTLLDEDNATIRIRIAHGLSTESMAKGIYRLGEGITGSVVKTGRSIVVPDIWKDPRFLHKTGSRNGLQHKAIAFLSVPIKVEGKTIGALSADKEATGRTDFSADVWLLNIIATLIGQAVRLNRLVESDRRRLRDENLRLRQELKARFNLYNIVGSSNAMQQVYRLVEQVADSNATVLIRGESGTGKDLVAHAIHYASPRASMPFVKVNCTALPEGLLESELFGHEKGAFTGALQRKVGRFEMANGGTIFLDEIGDFPMHLQAKLLRVIQFKEFERVGGTESIRVDVRIIVATNKDLERQIEDGLFREDLYYRINVFPIYLPPLRERKDDIMLLADYFLERFAKEYGKSISRISTPAIEMLTSYHWPGNVRELENCIHRAVLLCDGNVLRSEHLPPSLQMIKKTQPVARSGLKQIVENTERELIIDALKKSKGRQRQAARELGITERMLGYKLRKYGIDPKAVSFRS